MLQGSAGALCEVHDLAMLDLDGVVYVGGDAVPGAPAHLRSARSAGQRLAFITNNASRPPSTVAEHLTRIGVPAGPEDVVTSAQAAARVLADRLPSGAPVVLLGAAGLREAVGAAGLTPVGVEDEAEALVTGYGPDVLWRDIMRAAVRVRDGLWWVASNTDLSIPTEYGTAPGHGVLVETVQRFAGVEPVVAGKPQRPLLDETVRRVGGDRPLMVGDRLDTDIAGGRNAGVESLLVLTGVTGLDELVAARPEERPTYLAPDLRGLLEQHPEVVATGRRDAAARGRDATTACEVGGWRAEVERGRLVVHGAGGTADWWRAVAVAGWTHVDAAGEPVGVDGLRPPRSHDG